MILAERWQFVNERFGLAPVEPYWHRARFWWSERSLREQLLLGTLSALGIFSLLLLGVVVPLRDMRTEA